MNFLCDVHISYKLVNYLNRKGHNAIHVNQILDKWLTADDAIGAYADANELVVISKDSDFRDSHFVLKTPRKVIRICLGNVSNQRLIALFEEHLDKLENELKAEAVYIEIHDPMVSVFTSPK